MTHGAVLCVDTAVKPLFIERVQLRERVQMERDDVIYYYYETDGIYFTQLHLGSHTRFCHKLPIHQIVYN